VPEKYPAMRFQQVLREKNRHIQSLYGIIAVLTVLTLLAFGGWYSAPRSMTVFIPPDLNAAQVVRPGEPPGPTVMAFAERVLQQVFTWPEDGEQDYQANIERYRALLTKEFQTSLRRDLRDRLRDGEIQDRQRIMQLPLDSVYDNRKVERRGRNAWTVLVEMRATEYVGDVKVKEIDLIYEVVVVRGDMNREFNPWQLLLSGDLNVREKT
jgi:integrating conjugative element protein (TIGR03746 family)